MAAMQIEAFAAENEVKVSVLGWNCDVGQSEFLQMRAVVGSLNIRRPAIWVGADA